MAAAVVNPAVSLASVVPMRATSASAASTSAPSPGNGHVANTSAADNAASRRRLAPTRHISLPSPRRGTLGVPTFSFDSLRKPVVSVCSHALGLRGAPGARTLPLSSLFPLFLFRCLHLASTCFLLVPQLVLTIVVLTTPHPPPTPAQQPAVGRVPAGYACRDG
jgi:hypothetical protein